MILQVEAYAPPPPSWTDNLPYYVTGLIFAALILWALRSVVIWYSGIGKIHENQNEQTKLLEKIFTELQKSDSPSNKNLSNSKQQSVNDPAVMEKLIEKYKK